MLSEILECKFNMEILDGEMGPAESLHASAYYSEYNERFDFDLIRPLNL